jgi:hypothetical protein
MQPRSTARPLHPVDPPQPPPDDRRRFPWVAHRERLRPSAARDFPALLPPRGGVMAGPYQMVSPAVASVVLVDDGERRPPHGQRATVGCGVPAAGKPVERGTNRRRLAGGPSEVVFVPDRLRRTERRAVVADEFSPGTRRSLLSSVGECGTACEKSPEPVGDPKWASVAMCPRSWGMRPRPIGMYPPRTRPCVARTASHHA